MEKKKGKKLSIFRVVCLLIFLVSLVSSILFGIIAFRSGFLPSKYIVFLSVFLIVLNLILALLLLCRKVILNIIGIILALVFSVVFIVGYNGIDKTFSVLHDIINQNVEEEIDYYVFVLKDSSYDSLASLNGTPMGILDQENLSKLKDKVSEKVSVTYHDYTSIGEMVGGLENHEVDSIVVSSVVYDLVLEEYDNFDELFRKIDALSVEGKIEKVSSNIESGKSFILYISGLDTRGDGAVAQIGLSDVNILAVVNPVKHNILLVNVPRDYYVQVHGKTGLKDKLTHAGLYGVETSTKTMEDLFDINVNAYLKVNFAAVTTLVDAIDGIDVYSDTTFNSSHMKGWVVQKGNNHMNGAKALAYARERYAYASGDRHRGQNQQAVITAIINKMSQNKSYLLKYADVLESAKSYFMTNVEMEDIQGLVKEQLNTMAGWNVESISVNGTNSSNYTYSFPKQSSYVMVPIQSTIDSAKDRISSVMRGN